MVCRDDVTRSLERENLQEDETSAHETVPVEENDATDTDNLMWAAAEGYSPLTDLSGDGQAMFMAFPSAPGGNDDEDDENNGGGGGVFFADMSAFGPMSTADDDDDEDRAVEREDHHEQQPSDYQSIADKALRELEEEYITTIHNPAKLSVTEAAAPPITLDNNNNNHNQNSTAGDTEEKGARDSQFSLDQKQSAKDEIPAIDTEAVKKAVNAIRFKDKKLTSKFDKWQLERGLPLAPREHQIIPPTPLAAFRKRSEKARQATVNLSRAATIVDALHRLHILSFGSKQLIIHVVGADIVECGTDQKVRTLFGPLVRWLGASAFSPKSIRIVLVGPNVPAAAAERPTVNLLPTTRSKISPLEEATATSVIGCYHEYKSTDTPDLCIAFNAGIWGYEEWRPTLEFIANNSTPTYLVVTSYTLQEAEDDYDVVADVFKPNQCVWKVEANPFGSRQKRETATAVAGREYKENAAWQAWKLGQG